MLKFSLGVPKKATKRLPSLPELSDIQELLKQAEDNATKDFGVAWSYNNVEFKLFVRTEAHVVMWRMWNSTVAENLPPWISHEKNARVLQRQVVACCNELTNVKVSRPASIAGSIARSSDAISAIATEIENQFLEAIAAGPDELQTAVLDQIAKTGKLAAEEKAVGSHSQRMTASLMQATLQLARRFAEQYNRNCTKKEHQIIFTDVGEVVDFIPSKEGVRATESEKVIRWRASTTHETVSARGRVGEIEFFLVSAADALSLGTAEKEFHSAGRFVLSTSGGVPHWTRDGLPVSAQEIRRVVLDAIARLVKASRHASETPRLMPSAAEMEKRNLAQKIVSQQEELQRRIARDLHDAVIADVTLLKRAILGEQPVSREQAGDSLDRIASRLREICYDLSPSDLKDWGLQTTLEALLEQIESRTHAQCSLNCAIELPSLDSFVELHIFRIVQESLNNAAKYSHANNIAVDIKTSDKGWLMFRVRDDGVGFDPNEEATRTKDGGMGRTSMQERVELIRALFPARLEIQSQPGQGTATTLYIKVQ